MSRPRSAAIDVARGLAVVLMIQTHAYDGWVAPPARATTGFAITRFLAIFPLPTFLLLAGVGVALRLRAAERREEPAAQVRRELVRRGLEIVAAGYGLNLALGLIDGADRLATYLRVDVLHAIGLALALAAALLPSRGTASTRRLVPLGLGLFVGLGLLSMPGTRLGHAIGGPARYLLALVVEVPGITDMPLVPLGAWLGLGLAFGGTWLSRERGRGAQLALALLATLVAIGAASAMELVHARLGGRLDRAHPAILANLVDLGARAIALVALTIALVPREAGPATRALAKLGRHSLLAYAVHLPFAYGRISRPIAHRLDVPQATLGLALLLLFTGLVVATRREDAAR